MTKPEIHAAGHEPLFRIAKRDAVELKQKILVRVGAVALAFLLDALFVWTIRTNNGTFVHPGLFFQAIFAASFSTTGLFMIFLKNTVNLLCIAVALAPAFKMRFWNIGAEGQVLMGGLATALCIMRLGSVLPTPLLFLVMFVTSILCGALWGVIPAFFKANWNTNETLFTLMMNYMAIQLVAYTVDVLRGDNPQIPSFKIGTFPPLFGQDAMINILIIAALTVLMYFYLKKTKHGYEIAVVGESERTAKYAGINVKWVTIRTMLISGGLCGLCGLILVAGDKRTLATNTAGGNGFTAIIVAWLAKFNTLYMTLISMLIVFMEAGGRRIASRYQLNDYLTGVLSGVALFCILGSEFFLQYRVIPRHKAEKGGEDK
jgi:simple sugar transport system permease protein